MPSPDARLCLACRAPLDPADRFCPVCGEPAPADVDDRLIGTIVGGRFKVLQAIGEGAMAIVYRAEQVALRRFVALKVLRAEYSADRGWMERFRREAEVASRIRHPSAVGVYDFGRLGDGRLFIAMELVPGVSVGSLTHKRGLAWRRACRLAQQIAEVLHEAHEAGVVHRDLKPQNVMVSRRGHEELARVLDFGIALVRTGDSARLTAPNLAMGTPDFMAPEVCVGQPASAKSDIYALGAMLYEMLCGDPLYPDRSAEDVMKAHIHEPPPRLAEREGLEVPSPVDALVDTMLAKDPDERPATMDDVARQLSWALGQDSTAFLRVLPQVALKDVDTPSIRKLLQRLEKTPDFPAFAGNISELNALMDDEDATPDRLADVVLRDLGVTEKLLRVVNSAYYRRGRKPVTTVSRAVVVLGFEQVRRIATSLLLWEHLAGERQESLEGAVHAIASGLLARELARGLEQAGGPAEPEHAAVGAMLHRFGRQLVQLHLPEDAAAVAARAEVFGGGPNAEEQAAEAVLGIGLHDLGMAVAQWMQFPPALVEAMQKPARAMEQAPRDERERTVVLSALSNEVADALAGPADAQARALSAAQRRFGRGLGVELAQIETAIADAAPGVRDLARALEMVDGEDGPRHPVQRPMGRLLTAMEVVAREQGVERRPRDTPGLQAMTPEDVLRNAAGQVSELVQRDARLDDVVVAALEGMFRGAEYDRVIFALRDFRTDHLTGRYGLGGDTRERLGRFVFPFEGTPDRIRRALVQGEDLVVRDVRMPGVRQQLPDWLMESMAPGAFAIFPLLVRGTVVGLIYGDTPGKGTTPAWLSSGRLAAVRRMREDVVRALVAFGRRRRS